MWWRLLEIVERRSEWIKILRDKWCFELRLWRSSREEGKCCREERAQVKEGRRLSGCGVMPSITERRDSRGRATQEMLSEFSRTGSWSFSASHEVWSILQKWVADDMRSRAVTDTCEILKNCSGHKVTEGLEGGETRKMRPIRNNYNSWKMI